MIFHWSLSDSKSPQISKTLLSILSVLNNAVAWMVTISPPTSKSSSPFNNPLVTVPKVPITIGIIITFMFHSFFRFPSKVEVFILLFTFFHAWSNKIIGVIYEYLKQKNKDLLAHIWLLYKRNSHLKPYHCVYIITIRQEYLKPLNWIQDICIRQKYLILYDYIHKNLLTNKKIAFQKGIGRVNKSNCCRRSRGRVRWSPSDQQLV